MPFPATLSGALRRHLVPLIAALGGLLLAAVGGEAVLQSLDRQARREALDRVAVGAGVVEQLVLRRIEAVEMLHRLTQSWFALREAGNEDGAAALQAHLAATANSGIFGFTQVATIDAAGWMIWSSVPGSAAPVFLGDREHFRVHEQGLSDLFVSTPLLGRVSNRWTVQLTRPLRDFAGAFGGVVVVSMDLINLSEALAELHLDDFDHALLLLRDGTVAAHSRAGAGRIGRKLAETDPLTAATAERGLGAVERTTPDGHRTFTGWHALPGTPLTAAYVIDEDAALAGLGTTRAAVRASIAALAVFAFALAAVAILLSERRRARRALQRTEAERSLAEQARRVFEQRIAGLPAVVYDGAIDANGGFQLRHVSASLARIVGWQPGQFADGLDWRDLSADPDGDERAAFLQAVLRDGFDTREYRMRRPGGEPIWMRDHLRRIGDEADGAVEVVGYLVDITEEREIQLKAEASGQLATLGEMATGLAHELNQPLAVMSLAADNATRALSRRGAEAIPDALERLSRIGSQARRARDIVDHLRVFGRPDEGGAPEPLPLATAVEGALVLTAAALRSVGIAVEVDLPDDLPPVLGRLVPLEQTVVNLVLNARDAIQDTGRNDGRIRIHAEQLDGHVRMSVIDNGAGIPESVIYRLFQPFFTTKAPGKGTGLGLPLCHATMRSFGGSIAAANGSAGAVFTLDFRAAA